MNNFRKLTLLKIAENSGLLSKIVEQALDHKQIKFKTLGSVGPGTTVLMPENPIKSDGSVDIVINIRGIAGGDTKTASNLGVNAVIVTAEAGGLGSKENLQSYGYAGFINDAISKVLGFLKNQFPDKNIHRGKLIISGFSGGGSAIANILAQRDKVNGPINGILFNDALHASPGDPRLKAIIDYAKEAIKDPDKKFKLIHTAVVPGTYASTTDVANYILKELELGRQKNENYQEGITPASEAMAGGASVIQLYDRQDPYMVKNEEGQLKPNLPGTAGWQHIKSLEWGNNNAFKDMLI